MQKKDMVVRVASFALNIREKKIEGKENTKFSTFISCIVYALYV